MNVSLEISMYPLADEYIFAIQAFIDSLGSRTDLEVVTNTMSTQVFGEFDAVMDALRAGLAEAWQEPGKSVFAMKIINSDLRP